MPKLSKPEKAEVIFASSQAGLTVIINATRVYGSEPVGAYAKDIFKIEVGRIKEALKSKRRLYDVEPTQGARRGGETA